jgi:hypothetical protein
LDDPDYVDFSLAETMVSRDPRLRALKKRLQAKKQLLSQLNKMYTCFLGGNVAACKFCQQCIWFFSQGRIQEFKKGGSVKRVRAKRAENFGLTTPLLPNHAHFY